MITVKQQNKGNYLHFTDIADADNHVVFYPDLFTGDIIKVFTDVFAYGGKKRELAVKSLAIGLSRVSAKIFSVKGLATDVGALACICLEQGKINITRKDYGDHPHRDRSSFTVPCKKGSVIIVGAEFRKRWNIPLSRDILVLHEEKLLPFIYLSTKLRLAYGKNIRKCVSFLNKLAPWEQCIQKYKNLSYLGSGSFANIFREKNYCGEYAIKLSKIDPKMVDTEYSAHDRAWHEIFILKEILYPILKKNICPNLPLLIDNFTCKKCKLTLGDKKDHYPCIITIIELADGTVKNYLGHNRSEEEIYILLFQIMAGLHAIQFHGQIMNYDIKKENVLIYNVYPGGVWKYIIHGKPYYIPNRGVLFVLNDFGLSRSMSPKFPMAKSRDEETFRLGSRYAVVSKNKFIPLNVPEKRDSNCDIVSSSKITWEDGTTSHGAEFRQYLNDKKIAVCKPKFSEEARKALISQKIIPDVENKNFFDHPEIVPPFEFYNDTQDVIRMIIGGKRTTQKGHHRLYETIPPQVVDSLSKYNGKGEALKDNIFSTDPSQVLAGYFIEKFFGGNDLFTTLPKNTVVLAEYNIS